MSRSNWIPKLFGRKAAAPACGTRPGKMRALLTVEELESRWRTALLTVNTLADNTTRTAS